MHRFIGALFPLLIFCNIKPVHLRRISHQDCKPGLAENEFAFGGNGYVAVENKGFDTRELSHIKFSFKTAVDEGLVYFTVAPVGHFESIELRNGKVIYKFQVNSDQVEMAADKRYDDGKWHVLEIRWIQEKSSLVIDESVESVARAPGHFKSFNLSAVYFGGFKGQHNIEGVTEKGFNGSIKDVELEGISRRLSIHTDMMNVSHGCHRRRRRQTHPDQAHPQGVAHPGSGEFYASYIGSTNVELSWKTNSCFDAFVIRCLKEANGTYVDKNATDYLIEIDGLEPDAMYMFALTGINNLGETFLNTTNYTTRKNNHTSLIVTSVTNSSLSVRWTVLDSFVVSLSGDSYETTITDGTNTTFENLKPGGVYNLKLFDSHTNDTTERKVATIPEPVYAEAVVSNTEIKLKWESTTEVEVMYSRQQQQPWESRTCKLERLSGLSGSISHLSYGCVYKLDVYAVSGGRRITNNQTIHLEIDAIQAENFSCRTGDIEGRIQCKWKNDQRPQDACFKYQLKYVPSNQPDKSAETVSTSSYIWNFDKLKAGLTYSISILSITENGSSTSVQTTNTTAKTGIDDNYLKSQGKSTSHSITVSYFDDKTRVIDYYNVTTNGTSYYLNDSATKVFLEGLDAGYCHSFTASAVSQDIPSRVLEHDICTVPYAPTVDCLSANATSSSLMLVIKKPDIGHVDHYNITATEGDRLKWSALPANASTINAEIRQLRTYTDYKIIAKSLLKGRKVQSEDSSSRICRTAEGIPGPVQHFSNRTYQTTSVVMEWLAPILKNGEIIYYIMRYSNRVGDSGEKRFDGIQVSGELHSLEAGTMYNISISACTKVGEGPMVFKDITLKDDQASALLVALASLLAILFAVLIALLLFYYIRKSPQRMMSLRRMSNRLRNPTDIAMVFPQPSVTCKPIKLSQFLECVTLLEKDSGLKFTEEYEDLKYVGRNQSREEAELQCNRVKNRFTNILPYDISRVKLLPMEDEDGSDYINANWIPGFNSKREFIATQGPLPSTINDFWRMVWENNCQAIVMLTLCIEKGHIKCEQYWPFDKEPVFYGDLKVEIQSETKTDEWSILEFKISLGAQSRKLKHFHYVGWPDMYVPDKKSLLEFVRVVRESTNTSNSKGPVVVHCSAGVGRTGTFIALDTLLLHIQEGHDLDVYGIVFQMRMSRVLMVQTEAQYVFIYECLHQVLQQPNGLVEGTGNAITEGDVKKENSQQEPNRKELESTPTSDSKEESSKKESESKPTSDSKGEPSKKESESKPTSDSKEEPSKIELESKPTSDSKEEPSKKELESAAISDSSVNKSDNKTVDNLDKEPQKENVAKEEDKTTK